MSRLGAVERVCAIAPTSPTKLLRRAEGCSAKLWVARCGATAMAVAEERQMPGTSADATTRCAHATSITPHAVMKRCAATRIQLRRDRSARASVAGTPISESFIPLHHARHDDGSHMRVARPHGTITHELLVHAAPDDVGLDQRNAPPG